MTDSPQDDRKQASARGWHYASLTLAGLSGLASLVLTVMLFANDFAVGSLDIADSLARQRAAEQFEKRPDDQALAARVEQFDLAMRKDYAVRAALARKTKAALLAALAVFFLSAAGAAAGRAKLPLPASAGQAGAPAGRVDRAGEKVRQNMLGRWAVLACGVLIVAVAGAAVVTLRPWQGGPLPAPQTRPAQATAGGPATQQAEAGVGNWPSFRGPAGDGVCTLKNIPDAWNEKTGLNIRWKVELPLHGAGSPVVWGDRVFVTAATKDARQVLCFDARTGKKLWAKGYTDTAANNDIKVFADYVYAAGTPVTDGRRVAAVFANGDVACFDVEGKELWSRNVGDAGGNPYGYGSSLGLYGGELIVLFDGVERWIAALDLATGNELWRRKRQDESWASPVVIAPGGRPQIIVSGNPTVSAWDPRTGAKLWWADVLGSEQAKAISTPIVAGGHVIAMTEEAMFALRPGGEGDVTTSAVAWRTPREVLEEASFPDAAGPVSDGELIYTFANSVVVCIDAATGRCVYRQAVDATATYASPAIAGGKLYLWAKAKTLIVRTGREYKLLGECELEESFDSTPAFGDGSIFIRGHKHLYGIGPAGPPKPGAKAGEGEN